jgi:hypothetical protein
VVLLRRWGPGAAGHRGGAHGGRGRSLIPEVAGKGSSIKLALERIQARLGNDAVRWPVLCGPQARMDAAVLSAAGGTAPANRSWCASCRSRPGCWAHLCVLSNAPTGLSTRAPCSCCWARTVEGGWWHRDQVDGGEVPLNVQRDYWLARSEHAGLLWIFRPAWLAMKPPGFCMGTTPEARCNTFFPRTPSCAASPFHLSAGGQPPGGAGGARQGAGLQCLGHHRRMFLGGRRARPCGSQAEA